MIGEIGLFVQDRWTINRLTLNVGLRYDQFIGGYPEQTLGPALYQPTRNYRFPATTGNNLKDITPRVQVGYDLFGNGKTALKVSLGKYVLATTPIGNPAGITTHGDAVVERQLLPGGRPAARQLLPGLRSAEPGRRTASAAPGRSNFGLLDVDSRVQPGHALRLGTTAPGTRSSRPACSTS